jgi:uncharacterized protein (TIGR00297 family)
MLDKQGTVLAAIMGAALLFFGGLQYFFLMIVFLLLAVIATKHQHAAKREMGIYEHERGWENVLYNGIVPTVAAVANPLIGPMPFICSIAAITSDKFASELGVLSGNPISLETLKPVKPGTSGAVSVFGFLMSLAGAMLLGVSAIIIFNVTPNQAFLIGLAGFFGSLVDSIVGILEEKGIGTKGTTNLICSIAGALAGLLIH